MNSPKIAIFGLGVMGSPMSQNIAKKGYQTLGYNRTPDRPLVREAAKAGVKVVSNIAEAAENADIILTCVGDEKDVHSLILGDGGIAEYAKPQALIIDFSTIGPTAARELATALIAQDLRFLDAPVTGGDVGAIASWALANLAPKMAQADFTPGFMVKHILKDLRLVQEAAQSGDLPCNLPGVTLAEQLLKSVQALGGSEQGSQAIVRAYREL